MPTNSFLLGLRQWTGDFLPFTLGNETPCRHHHQQNEIQLVLWQLFWFCGLRSLKCLGKGEEEVLLHHSRSCTLSLLYKVPSWQHSPMCSSVTAWGGQLTKLHCKPCWVLSTLHLIWANVNQKLTLRPREGSDIVVKHESADRVSSNMLLL